MHFKRATKAQARLRLALIGPSGSGKTYTSLSLATHLGGPIAVIDTERGSASKYADLFTFDTCELEDFDPRRYVEAIRAAEAAGYAVLVIDSLSHAWVGKGGALELVDRAAKRAQGANAFSAWRDVTPLHNQLVDAILSSRCHVIATLRSKTEYVQEKDERGRTQIRKVGLQPVQRDGLEYEFDVTADLDAENNLIVGKTRCPALHGRVYNRAGADVAEVLKGWLSDGRLAEPPRAEPKPEPAPKPQPKPRLEVVEPEPLSDTLCRRLEAAASETELRAVGSEIKAAHQSGQITDDERGALLEVYKTRRDALAKIGGTP